jgi:hypothetical protein
VALGGGAGSMVTSVVVVVVGSVVDGVVDGVVVCDDAGVDVGVVGAGALPPLSRARMARP